MGVTAERPPVLGDGRYVIDRLLGRGGMGVVYSALDRERQRDVALKILRRALPGSIYRFKREFRALAGITHANLVALHELVAEESRWFFTMELIDGVDFVTYVRGVRPEGSRVPISSGVTQPTSTSSEADTAELGPARAAGSPRASLPDVDRLRSGLRQLARGIHALHRSGHLHRDIKPTNVMVTGSGRVVLLDFGVVTELGRGGPADSEEVAGTPHYMAPEQARGEETIASDWYGVGAMLYEALTGTRPLSGSAEQVLKRKQTTEAAPPRVLVPDCPADLDRLCLRLLRIRPDERPSEEEILDDLGITAEPVSGKGPARALGPRDAALIGRAAEVGALWRAFDDTGGDSPVTVFIHGSSGTGKTALVQSFLDDLTGRGAAVVLAGRCYEREQVPYKAIDSLVDALSRHLAGLSAGEVDALLPRHVDALGRVFPVLRRVRALAAGRRRMAASPDPLELRQRAFEALRELLARLAERRPLVMFIDDLQWGDRDSAPLLADLMRPPDAPQALLIASYRSEDAFTSPLLLALADPGSRLGGGINRRDVALAPLGIADSRELAAALLGEPLTSPAVKNVAREAGGNPYFIQELVRHVRGSEQVDGPSRWSVSLDEVISSRVARLPAPARELLHIIAVAGTPLRQRTAAQAAQLQDLSAIDSLRGEQLIRASGMRADDRLEVFHDRIRETLVAALDQDRLRALHLQLAQELELDDHPDAEALANHYLAAGDSARAAGYIVQAADLAGAKLAFDRAAQLYSLALGLDDPEPDGHRGLYSRLGDALANAGRGAEAADAYLRAAEGAPPADRLELQRRAAAQLLRSGHIDQGIEVLRTVLATVGFGLAPTPRRALVSLAFRRARLRLRGLGFRERDESELAPSLLTAVDVSRAAGQGLCMADTIRGADMQTRNVLLALEAGEPRRVCRALFFEAGVQCVGGSRGRARARKILAAGKQLARRFDDPELNAWSVGADGLINYQEGNWRIALERTDAAGRMFRECSGVRFEIGTVDSYSVWSLYYLGELREMSARLERLLAEADNSGDLYTGANLRTGVPNTAWLARDDVAEAERQVVSAMRGWSPQSYHLQHYWKLFALTACDLYRGNGAAARRRLLEEWPALQRSLLLRIDLLGIEIRHLRARCALAVAEADGGDRDALHAADRDARFLEHGGLPWSRALAGLIAAGVAHHRGRIDAAGELLLTAAAACDAAGMAMYAAAARRVSGTVVGGDHGSALIAAGDAALRDQGVRNPSRFAALLVPGFGRSG